MIKLIKRTALDKIRKTKGDITEVSITVATVGDSRTGKSEMSEKMEEVLSMRGANQFLNDKLTN